MALPRTPALDLGTYPADRTFVEQWLTWKETDGRKIPRAPYAYPEHPDRFVNAQYPDVWTDFATASEWAASLPGHALAFTIRDRDEHPEEDLVLIDYDNARDPDTGAVHPTVREHLAQADSYADVSTSKTGVHILCRGGLPDGVKTIDDALPSDEGFPDAGIEVYDSARFVAMTGAHIRDTPRETTDAQAFLDALVDEYATVTAGTPDELLDPPARSKQDLTSIETTTDIQDVFDAIQHTGPTDIPLRSSVTEERADGSKSLDPCWTTSDSGTRLAQVDDRWIYRKGMIGLDALQVVALEAGIITDERTYPNGEQFWEAVEALRDRGAHIPRYERDDDGTATGGAAAQSSIAVAGGSTDTGPHSVPAGTAHGGGDETADTAADTAAVEPLREYELARLRERVSQQRTTIDELETTIGELRAQLERREAQLAALREELTDNEDDRAAADRRRPDGPWTRVKYWLGNR